MHLSAAVSLSGRCRAESKKKRGTEVMNRRRGMKTQKEGVTKRGRRVDSAIRDGFCHLLAWKNAVRRKLRLGPSIIERKRNDSVCAKIMVNRMAVNIRIYTYVYERFQSQVRKKCRNVLRTPKWMTWEKIFENANGMN